MKPNKNKHCNSRGERRKYRDYIEVGANIAVLKSEEEEEEELFLAVVVVV